MRKDLGNTGLDRYVATNVQLSELTYINMEPDIQNYDDIKAKISEEYG